MSIFLLLFGYCLFLLLSIYFAGSEAGFISLNKEKYKYDLKQNSVQAIKIKHLVNNVSLVLIVTLLGNNLANIAATNIGHRLWVSIWDAETIVYFIIFSTLVFLILGEILPKLLFKYYSEKIIYSTGPSLNFFIFLFAPLSKILVKISDFLVSPLTFWNKNKNQFSKMDFSNILLDGHQEGFFSKEELHFLNTVSSLSQIKVMEVMQPLIDIFVIHKHQNLESIIQEIKKTELNIISVYDERIDNIVGYINVIDIFNSSKSKKIAKDFMKEVKYIPESITLDNLYTKFSFSENELFVIVNEYGGCAGIVHKIDVIQRIFGFGYHFDENKKKHYSNKDWISSHGKDRYTVDTLFDIDDFNSFFKVNIEKKGFETLGGFINFLFKEIPDVNEKIRWKNLQFKILKASSKGVDLVEVKVNKPRSKKKQTLDNNVKKNKSS